MTREIAKMVDTLGKLPAPDSSEEAVAGFLMMRLHGYRYQNSCVNADDTRLIVDVLQAYARMIQNAGVTV